MSNDIDWMEREAKETAAFWNKIGEEMFIDAFRECLPYMVSGIAIIVLILVILKNM